MHRPPIEGAVIGGMNAGPGPRPDPAATLYHQLLAQAGWGVALGIWASWAPGGLTSAAALALLLLVAVIA